MKVLRLISNKKKRKSNIYWRKWIWLSLILIKLLHKWNWIIKVINDEKIWPHLPYFRPPAALALVDIGLRREWDYCYTTLSNNEVNFAKYVTFKRHICISNKWIGHIFIHQLHLLCLLVIFWRQEVTTDTDGKVLARGQKPCSAHKSRLSQLIQTPAESQLIPFHLLDTGLTVFRLLRAADSTASAENAFVCTCFVQNSGGRVLLCAAPAFKFRHVEGARRRFHQM